MENQNVRFLEFEKPIYDIESKIDSLRRGGGGSEEIQRLQKRLEQLEQDVYGNLSPWEQVQLARHPMRPTMKRYIDMICDEFVELHGDRRFGDDAAVIGGLARIDGRRFVIVGHEKGGSTREKLSRNFGMASPEGFRKALRILRLAEKFRLPVLSFIDTPGAHPGVGAEERGQPQAIAENLEELFNLRTPIVVVIIGEGGSGGALALAVGDRILMLEHAIYSVISPEGCAAILWKSREKAPEAAAALKLTAGDCYDLGVVDYIIEEISGASHRNPEASARAIKDAVMHEFDVLERVELDELLERRTRKFSSMGRFMEGD
ncbi:MAG TPA: acetyl-CoA carboxylase carboxyltransferase subunit alpha [Candidatus Eisenbacteria bacterium]|uniref:Acetyl-coenzyme A carboxylase carboxyl transferase subunit alpha n=1 Tax=Eiseniibacteriota bacterium TaxID=2212470 RepID=A0A7V2AU25_UNCEI|nr:acetyl-CoA carboxylase carboxyltransferase subunit alpha [Candidatus Eisenbacteria bacterium]